MSWSTSYLGTAAKVADALENYSEKLSGTSRDEYDRVKPALISLVKENFDHQEGAIEPVIKITANGHGYFNGKDQLQGTFQVQIERIYTQLV